MAGRGRGFGRGGGFRRYVDEEPFVPFPEGVKLPDLKLVTVEKNSVEENLVRWNFSLLKYWKTSPYHLEETIEKKGQDVDIERYSDLTKPKDTSTRDSIYQFLQINTSNFPEELVKDSRQRRNVKRVRWNPGMQKIDDYFDKIEQKYQDHGEKDEKEKKEGEDEEENDEEAVEEAEEEYSDDGDYNQNRDFDDDEDDFNMNDDDNDEPFY